MDHLLLNFPTNSQIRHLQKEPFNSRQQTKSEEDEIELLNNAKVGIERQTLIRPPRQHLPDGLRSPTQPDFPFHPRGPIPRPQHQAYLFNHFLSPWIEDDSCETEIVYKPYTLGEWPRTPAASRVWCSQSYVGDSIAHPTPAASKTIADDFPTFELTKISGTTLELNRENSNRTPAAIEVSAVRSRQDSLPFKRVTNPGFTSSSHRSLRLRDWHLHVAPLWSSVHLEPSKDYLFERFPANTLGRWPSCQRRRPALSRSPQGLYQIDRADLKTPVGKVTKNFTPDDEGSRNRVTYFDSKGDKFLFTLPGFRGIAFHEATSLSNSMPCDKSFLFGICDALQTANNLVECLASCSVSTRSFKIKPDFDVDPITWESKSEAIRKKLSQEIARLLAHQELFPDEEVKKTFVAEFAKHKSYLTEYRRLNECYLDAHKPISDNDEVPWLPWGDEMGFLPILPQEAILSDQGFVATCTQVIPTQGLIVLEAWRKKYNASILYMSMVDAAAAPTILQYRLSQSMVRVGQDMCEGDIIVKRGIGPMPLVPNIPPGHHEVRGDIFEMARLLGQLRGRPNSTTNRFALYQRTYMQRKMVKAFRNNLPDPYEVDAIEW